MAIKLRPYQRQAIEDLRQAYRKGAKAALLVGPTGMGKTCIFTAIAQSAAARGRNVLILVHRRELLRQASAKLTAVGLPHSQIAAGLPITSDQVQVASVQTLVRRLARMDWEPGLIIIDEAHHAVAGNTWGKILDHWPNALVLGVSATPCRLDGRGLGNAFDALVHGPSVADLTHQGFLADARIYAPPVLADLSSVRTRAGDYAADQAADAMDRPTVTGNAVEHYQRHAPGCPAIAFTCNTKHAASVAAQFQAAGIRAATLLGNIKPEERDRLVAGLADGSVQVLVTVDVVSEGFDCPGASVAILLRPTKSLGLYLQQVGRVLRPKADGSKALILDHVGNVMRHGFPDDHREWTLADGVKRGPRGEPAPSVRTCPKCYAAFKPQPTCPVCGANCAPPPKPAMQQIDGELQELRRGQLHTARRAQGRARTLSDLLVLAKERGYSPGWAYKVYASRGKR